MEPEEGKYAWLYDENYKKLIQGALDRGLKLCFRIYNNGQDNLRTGTPDYVRRAGAKGYTVKGLKGDLWTPYPDDPIFQEKLEKFVEAFAKEYFRSTKQDKNAVGRMSSVLKPVADRYNQKTQAERYQFRRLLRSLVKWYGYVSQVARMFDEELHKENVFCAYLLKLLPPDEVSPLDLEGKLQLEYYKLQKTFAGAIELEHAKGVYEPATQKGALGHDPKEPLDEIILKINEKFKGEFTNADRVLLTALHDRLLADPKLAKLARSSDPQIFTESIFPKAFDTAAQDSYLEAQDTFSSLFEDTSKYKAIMSALAEWLYGEFRKK